MHQQVQQRSAFQTAVSQSDQPQSGALGAQAEAFEFTSDDNSDVDDDDVDSTPSATATESVTAAAATATRESDIIMRVVCLIAPRVFVLCMKPRMPCLSCSLLCLEVSRVHFSNRHTKKRGLPAITFSLYIIRHFHGPGTFSVVLIICSQRDSR